jgi:hypothetical protein
MRDADEAVFVFQLAQRTRGGDARINRYMAIPAMVKVAIWQAAKYENSASRIFRSFLYRAKTRRASYLSIESKTGVRGVGDEDCPYQLNPYYYGNALGYSNYRYCDLAELRRR